MIETRPGPSLLLAFSCYRTCYRDVVQDGAYRAVRRSPETWGAASAGSVGLGVTAERVVGVAHNPEAEGSNPSPATTSKNP